MLDPSLLAAGIYTISYTVHDSIMTQCQATATRPMQVSVCTGLSEDPVAGLLVYSTGKQVHFHLGNSQHPEGTIRIFNGMGQEIRKEKISEQETKIDMTLCSSGIYFITVQAQDALATRKIFLE